MDPLFPIYPRPTPKYRIKFAAKRDKITRQGAKKRVPRIAEEYAIAKGTSFAKEAIYQLFQKLEAVRKAANGRRQRSEGWMERYLTAAYSP